ncbi:membrane protein [Hylemonella gracilis str. Niagara R]|uniref:Membrane protein n=1 Tax=Hylemonella gracilis str. Niagara R TaxID=1458275 RepID=A0A016XEM6_9BURK|nr:MipA/OmpV family protein [Hylemonella gracilis]EYC50286.1 membrane protein [Hylemonella gracilis str. Niagara R]
MRARGIDAARPWTACLAAARVSTALFLVLVAGSAWTQGLATQAESVPEEKDFVAESGLPRWELGAGVAMVDFPLYRGAAERQRYWLPTPYVQYRGDYLQMDRERMRSPLFERENVEIDLSLNGSVPVDSSESRARRGMDDLDPTLELGPELRWVLLRDERRTARRGDTFIDLRVPLRPVFAVSLERFEHVGWLAQPTLNLAYKNVLGTGWNLGASVAWLYGDAGYHRYFYDVGARDASAERPAYQASGGASGQQRTLTLSRVRGDFWLGAFFRQDDLHHAVFADSPLVQRRSNHAMGLAFGWTFARSSERVPTRE